MVAHAMSEHSSFPEPGAATSGDAAKPSPAGSAQPESVAAAPKPSPAGGRSGGRAVFALGGALVGFALGRAVDWPAPETAEPAAKHRATVTSARSPESKKPRGPSELALALATDEASRALKGRWIRAQIGPHPCVETTGPKGAIELRVSPEPKTYSLAIVAQAVGVASDAALETAVLLNGRKLGRWRIGAEWDMQALILPSGTLVDGLNTVEFELPASAAPDQPMLAVATVHLGPLFDNAYASLSTEGAGGSLIRGYYGREGDGADAVTWSAGLRTRIGLLLAPSDSDYELELQGYAFAPLQPLNVEAVVNSTSKVTARVGEGPQTVFRFPRGAFINGLNIVELVYPKAVRPSEMVKGSEDGREIALRIAKVSARPAAHP